MTEEVFLFLPLKVLEKEFVLSNGTTLPKISLGVNNIDGFENMYNTVDRALEVGYRSFDCSPHSYVEENLGSVLELLLPKYDLKRSDIVIVSKIHPRDYGSDNTTEAFCRSSEFLKTDYLDLFLMQWPGGHNLDSEAEENLSLREETWKELVELYHQGKVKAMGVCNFTPKHLDDIRNYSKTVPVLNQVEFHPRFPQVELMEYCKDNNILLQACGVEETCHPLVLNEDAVKQVAKQLNKSPTQVVLKWVLNKNVGVISQSDKAKTIKQNFELFDFALEKRDMDMINEIQTREKYLRNPVTVV